MLNLIFSGSSLRNIAIEHPMTFLVYSTGIIELHRIITRPTLEDQMNFEKKVEEYDCSNPYLF